MKEQNKSRIIPNTKLLEQFKRECEQMFPQEIVEKLAKEVHKRYS